MKSRQNNEKVSRAVLILAAAALLGWGGKIGFSHIREAVTESVEKPRVALTFDDGPHPVYTVQLSKELAERNIKASFFLIGQKAERYKDVVKQLKADGHLIGNHSYDHVNLADVSEKEACSQILRTCNLIYEITGEFPNYVRPPFGKWDDDLECSVELIPVFWTLDSRDWEQRDADGVAERVLRTVEEEDIILMHDCYQTSVEAALEIVDELTERGYEFVTVDALVCE
ncbi:MAG: polysaccharide deacetylase family protein [Ruminococcus sp.]